METGKSQVVEIRKYLLQQTTINQPSQPNKACFPKELKSC